MNINTTSESKSSETAGTQKGSEINSTFVPYTYTMFSFFFWCVRSHRADRRQRNAREFRYSINKLPANVPTRRITTVKYDTHRSRAATRNCVDEVHTKGSENHTGLVRYIDAFCQYTHVCVHISCVNKKRIFSDVKIYE